MRPRNERNETEVAQTLRALDALGRIECRPGFEARLQARIRQRELAETGRSWKPLAVRYLLPAMIALLVILNGATALKVLQPSEPQQSERQQQLTRLAAEYSLTRDPMDAWLPQE